MTYRDECVMMGLPVPQFGTGNYRRIFVRKRKVSYKMKKMIPVLVALVLIAVVVVVAFGGKISEKYSLSPSLLKA